MAKILLATDLHLTDNPLEEYRWEIFDKTIGYMLGVDWVYLLGDIWDRKDRHSAALVNRSVKLFSLLPPTKILMGNHDEPLTGLPYWTFLNELPNVTYITDICDSRSFNESYRHLFLPFNKNPVDAWKNITFSDYDGVFMHQTGAGVTLERNYVVKVDDAHKLPDMSKARAVYSGDVHRPQTIGNITYIGTPYPVRFGEDWPGRVLLIDTDKPGQFTEIQTSTMRRAILDLNPAKLNKLVADFKSGDQIRVRFHTTPDNITHLQEDEARAKELIAATGATLVSYENIIEEEIAVDGKTVATDDISAMDEKSILRLFATEEKITGSLLDAGMNILNQAKQ